MATCKDCIHYHVCIFRLKNNENEKPIEFYFEKVKEKPQ